MYPNFLARAVRAIRSYAIPWHGTAGRGSRADAVRGGALTFLRVLWCSWILVSAAATLSCRSGPSHCATPLPRPVATECLRQRPCSSLCGAAVLLFCTFALLPALQFALITRSVLPFPAYLSRLSFLRASASFLARAIPLGPCVFAFHVVFRPEFFVIPLCFGNSGGRQSVSPAISDSLGARPSIALYKPFAQSPLPDILLSLCLLWKYSLLASTLSLL